MQPIRAHKSFTDSINPAQALAEKIKNLTARGVSLEDIAKKWGVPDPGGG